MFESFCVHNDIEYSVSYSFFGHYPRGFVFKNTSNGKYHIALNGKHDIVQLRKTIIHEITHIMNGHLDESITLKDLLESETESLVKEINLSLETNHSIF